MQKIFWFQNINQKKKYRLIGIIGSHCEGRPNICWRTFCGKIRIFHFGVPFLPPISGAPSRWEPMIVTDLLFFFHLSIFCSYFSCFFFGFFHFVLSRMSVVSAQRWFTTLKLKEKMRMRTSQRRVCFEHFFPWWNSYSDILLAF